MVGDGGWRVLRSPGGLGFCCSLAEGPGGASSSEPPWKVGRSLGAECQRGDGAKIPDSQADAPCGAEGPASGNSPISPESEAGRAPSLDEH